MMGRRKKVPEKKPEEYIPEPKDEPLYCPRCGRRTAETIVVEFCQRHRHCNACGLIFSAGNYKEETNDTLCPFCGERIRSPRVSCKEGVFDSGGAWAYHCGSCGRTVWVKRYRFFPLWPRTDPFINPYQCIGSVFRWERNGVTALYGLKGLCSDGNYLAEALIRRKDGRIVRRMMKRRMREDGSPAMPRGCMTSGDMEWRSMRSEYADQTGKWYFDLD